MIRHPTLRPPPSPLCHWTRWPQLKARMLELWEPLLVIQEEERVKREQDEAEAITRNEQRFEDAFVKEKVNKAACLHVSPPPPPRRSTYTAPDCLAHATHQ